jgi:hypothetical protein
MTGDATGELFACSAFNEFSERLAERQNFSQVVGGKVRARFESGCAFAADLNDPNDLAIQKYRSANNFLNRFRGFPGYFHAFKDGGMPRGGEIIVNLRATVTRSLRSQS